MLVQLVACMDFLLLRTIRMIECLLSISIFFVLKLGFSSGTFDGSGFQSSALTLLLLLLDQLMCKGFYAMLIDGIGLETAKED